MATYYAENAGSTVAPPARNNPNGVTVVPFLMTPIAFAVDDVVILAQIPCFRSHANDPTSTWVLQVHIDIPAWDSGTTVQFDVGDVASRSTYLSNLTLGRSAAKYITSLDPSASAATGTTSGSIGVGLFPKKYTADDDIRLTFDAGPGAGLVTTNPLKGFVVFSTHEHI
jgi:hypothetical protein